MRSPLIRITTILLIIGLSQSKSTSRDLNKQDSRENEEYSPESILLDDDDSSPKKDTLKKDQSEEKLPILPPIILLDFDNDTDDDNATAEEKSKRTVNGGLGYGLDKNSLQPRRHNYYFPGGKSGTTVSIEESISPFLPKTIIEKVQPTNQANYFGGHRSSFSPTYSALQSQGQSLNAQRSPQSQFGLRTKPQKSATSFNSYQSYLPTPKPTVSPFAGQNSGFRNRVSTTTQSPLAFSSTESVRYVTAASYANPSFNYVTSGSPVFSSAGQRQTVQSNVNSHGFASASQSVQSSTVSPTSYGSHFASSSSQNSNKPTYTVENGVRYENKIFWKYPDGRVSDVPPATYVETSYPEYSPQEAAKSQTDQTVYETSTESSVLSQGPVQFPSVPEQNGEPNPFVSSESLSSSLRQQQAYRLAYQNLLSQKQNANLAQQRKPSSNVAPTYSFSSPSGASSGRVRPGASGLRPSYESQYQQTPSRYPVNSPNPEYAGSYVTEATVNSSMPVSSFFGSSAGSKKQSFTNADVSSYSNLRYSDLLNYNPSISEYIRNPSSILNVHPTFVQTGNSLIPVIILRVDGAAPVQNKASQNVNLKALLQQYLVQYANSIQELARPSSYDLGTTSNAKIQTSASANSPVLDLIRLTQEDARETPGYSPDSYIGRSSYETSNVAARDFAGSHLERAIARQKVKSVQILDDSRSSS